MGTEYKDVDTNMEDSGNSCGSSVVSDLSGPSYQTELFDGDGVQVSDLEGEVDSHDALPLMQVGILYKSIHYLIGKLRMLRTSKDSLLND